MKKLISAAWILFAVTLAACDCPEAPDEWRGASLDGCSSAGFTCCSYSNDSCFYTLCQEACGEWQEESWACY